MASAADLSAELDKAFQQAGPAGDAFDAALRLRLEVLLREAKTPEQLRLIEARLVQALESTMRLSIKREACRVLWQIGSARAAPALKRLLVDPETVDIACYAVSSSRVAELGQAVRDALPGSKGKCAASLLNLLGQRRDREAVSLVTAFLKSDQPPVAAAAATALGKIGGRPAVDALDGYRRSVHNGRLAADDAYLRATESLEPAVSVPLWTALIAAKDESTMVRRMALLRLSEHAPESALPWLMAVLRGEDKALAPVAGQALRSVRGQAATARLAAGLPDFPPAGQVMVLESLGDVLPTETLLALVKRADDVSVRMSALRGLAERGGPQAAGMLLGQALSSDVAGQRREIFRLLRTMPGSGVTEAIVQAIPRAPASLLPELAQLLAARSADGVASPLLDRVGTGDRASTLYALRALRIAAGAKERGVLLRWLKASDDPEIREAIEQAIGAGFSRAGQAEEQAAWLLGEMASAQRLQDRTVLFRLLARTGTASALAKVVKTAREGSPEDRGAAQRALTEWPNAAALEPLVELASQPGGDAWRAQALRGAVDLLRKAALTPATKAGYYRRLMPLAHDAADRKLLLSGLAEVADAGALALIVPCLDDPSVEAEAGAAVRAVAAKLGPADDEAVKAAMKRVHHAKGL
jgi:HEAT repeat protein